MMKDHTPGIEEYFNVSDLRKYLYTYASNYCNNRDDLEDMLQEALLHIIHKLHTYRAVGSFKAWAVAVTDNVFKNKIRDTNKYYQRLADSSDYHLEQYSQPAVTDVDSRHNVQQIMYIVSHLPHRQSVVITLWLKGYSCSEIAHMLGITAGGVRNHIFHARKNIKKMLEK